MSLLGGASGGVSRFLVGLLALAAVAAIAGCGGSAGVAGSVHASRAARGAGLSDCERKGLFGPGTITPRGAEGTCRAPNGQMTTLVAFGRVVRLRDLSFKVDGARTATRLSGGPLEETARGIFVIVSVTLTNESRAVQRVTANQFELLFELRRHYADREATLLADPKSLWRLTVQGLPPGATATGELIFDVPTRLGARLVAGGFVAGVSFATVAAGHPVPSVRIGLSPLS